MQDKKQALMENIKQNMALAGAQDLMNVRVS